VLDEMEFQKEKLRVLCGFARDQIASQKTFAMTAISSSSVRDQNREKKGYANTF
jgi:hypothetical protein